MFSTYFNINSTASYIYFGGYESNKYNNVTWYNIKTTGTYAGYWTLQGKHANYGTANVGTVTDVIFNTGTSLIQLPTAVFNKLITTINKNCTLSSITGYYMCNCTTAI